MPFGSVSGGIEYGCVSNILIVLPHFDVVALERFLVVICRNALPLDNKLEHLSFVGQQCLAIFGSLGLVDFDILRWSERRMSKCTMAKQLRFDRFTSRVENVDSNKVDGVGLEAYNHCAASLTQESFTPVVLVLFQIVSPVADHITC